MYIGHISIKTLYEDGIYLKVDNANITIKEKDSIIALCDPFYNSSEYSMPTLHKYSFKEILSNIDKDEEIFIDDLKYICGICIV